ncbi:MAG: GAF domain-containing protein [Proteobacteria bacterium]|nr:GAF domain-containing protein [Pseudomonadota bacterium]MCP4922048.1 GAF domain-containing protein [Pseudomonadota bacterium]
MSEQVEATEALANRMRRLEALHTITLATSRGEDLDGVCDVAFRQLSRIVPIVRGGVARLEGQTHLTVFYTWNQGAQPTPDDRSLELDATPAGSAIHRRATIQMRTSGSVSLQWKNLRRLQRAGVRSVLYVPLMAENRVLGLISLGTDAIAGFTPEEIEAVGEVAARIAGAMIRTELQARVAGHTHELERRIAERTEQLEATTEQLVRSARLSTLGELSAGLAHELNQPISVVRGYVELLSDGYLEPGREERALELMGGALDRMARLVENLKSYSKAQPEVLEPFDLRTAVDMAIELGATLDPEIQVVWNRPDELVEALGDVHRVEQVVLNLLTNAVQATSDDGGSTVTLTCGAQDGRVFVRVQDEGAGVPDENRDRIFDPFFSTRTEGTGLGLSISARIVQEHGGTLALEDTESGARFRLVLSGP